MISVQYCNLAKWSYFMEVYTNFDSSAMIHKNIEIE